MTMGLPVHFPLSPQPRVSLRQAQVDIEVGAASIALSVNGAVGSFHEILAEHNLVASYRIVHTENATFIMFPLALRR